jgi:hypothetical protein
VDRHARSVPGFRSNGGRKNERQADSRFDTRYENGYSNDRPNGLPIPNFAPLPSYAGADDLSSVGGDSAYDSQYGGSRASFFSQRKEDKPGPQLGYFIGGGSGGNYFCGDSKSQVP